MDTRQNTVKSIELVITEAPNSGKKIPKENQTKVVSWPENVHNVKTFPSPFFICSRCSTLLQI